MKQKNKFLYLLFGLAACHHSSPEESLVLVQIHDRNGLSETVSSPERLAIYEGLDYLHHQPYKKVVRNFRKEGKTRTVLTTYHPNGLVWQLLEAREMRASGAFKEWFENGVQKIEATVIGGSADLTPEAQESWLFDGLCKVWNEKGILIAEIPYEKGALFGKARYYYDQGSLQRETPFIQNCAEGTALEFWEDGVSLKMQTSYQGNLKEGFSIAFWPDAKPCHEEEYQKGLLQKGIYWDRDEKVFCEVVDGSGFQALFDGNRLSEIREIRNGIAEGLVKEFDAKGELTCLYHWKNGKKQGEEIQFAQKKQRISLDWDQDAIHGIVKTWYENGQLQSQRELCHNKRSGMSCAWYLNGDLMLMEEYDDDKLVQGQYYRKKQSDPISTISHGNGLATLYDEEGVFLRKIIYSRGKPIDPEE